MFEWLTWKVYLGFTVVTTLLCLFLGAVAGTQADQFLESLRLQAFNSGMADWLLQVIFIPLKEAFSGNPIAAVVAGVLWPVTILWIIFMFLALVYGAIVPGVEAARGSITG
ncbi:MAG: hypothetical protein ACPG7F_08630 [Aggregatilineales bacterium]